MRPTPARPTLRSGRHSRANWDGNDDETGRAGFVEGALDLHQGRIET